MSVLLSINIRKPVLTTGVLNATLTNLLSVKSQLLTLGSLDKPHETRQHSIEPNFQPPPHMFIKVMSYCEETGLKAIVAYKSMVRKLHDQNH